MSMKCIRPLLTANTICDVDLTEIRIGDVVRAPLLTDSESKSIAALLMCPFRWMMHEERNIDDFHKFCTRKFACAAQSDVLRVEGNPEKVETIFSGEGY